MLLHPSSLPGAGPKGDLGCGARRFVDTLVAAGVSIWQVLPLGPPGGGSPYNSSSAYAGDPGLISLEDLMESGLLTAAEAQEGLADEGARRRVIGVAWPRFQGRPAEMRALADFGRRHEAWLTDYALYGCIKEQCAGAPWWEWPPAFKDRDAAALATIREHVSCQLRIFEQFLFFQQWHALRAYAAARGVRFFGDIPIFVAEDSADVWAHRDLFVLDAFGRPEIVTGVPPDYFSAHGQRWGNPHYRWERMESDGFAWWQARIATQRDLFDWIRIDHFRGFAGAWAIPFSAATATVGEWRPVPGDALLKALRASLGELPLIAEDLGLITDDVYALRDRYGLPGMRVLQFGFDGDPRNPHLPHNYDENCVAYTGTHDNDTTAGWYAGLAPAERERAIEYLGTDDIVPALVRAVIASVARFAIIPWQDVLGLGSAARMNTPGVPEGNWRFRFSWSEVSSRELGRLARLAFLYGRKTP